MTSIAIKNTVVELFEADHAWMHVAPLATVATSACATHPSGATVSIQKNPLVTRKLLKLQTNDHFGHASHSPGTDYRKRDYRSCVPVRKKGSRSIYYFIVVSKVRVATRLCSQALSRSQRDSHLGHRGSQPLKTIWSSEQPRAPP